MNGLVQWFGIIRLHMQNHIRFSPKVKKLLADPRFLSRGKFDNSLFHMVRRCGMYSDV